MYSLVLIQDKSCASHPINIIKNGSHDWVF